MQSVGKLCPHHDCDKDWLSYFLNVLNELNKPSVLASFNLADVFTEETKKKFGISSCCRTIATNWESNVRQTAKKLSIPSLECLGDDGWILASRSEVQ